MIWNKIYSFADVESKTPVNSRTLFQAASITPVSVYAAYLKAGQKDKAKQSDQKVLEINPENENAAEILKTL
ncbi:MAG: hypothetical protein MUW56_19000 [Chryseobacterium sp.]|nr:hypothetical protein [Chryseobacterium sp.]